MNYLKSIKSIKTASDLELSEREYDNIQRDAINLIRLIADSMYAVELDGAKYNLWYAIANILDSLNAQR